MEFSCSVTFRFPPENGSRRSPLYCIALNHPLHCKSAGSFSHSRQNMAQRWTTSGPPSVVFPCMSSLSPKHHEKNDLQLRYHAPIPSHGSGTKGARSAPERKIRRHFGNRYSGETEGETRNRASASQDPWSV